MTKNNSIVLHCIASHRNASHSFAVVVTVSVAAVAVILAAVVWDRCGFLVLVVVLHLLADVIDVRLGCKIFHFCLR